MSISKVILVHQAFVSPNEAGGTRHYELAAHCVSEGIDFQIIASDLSYLTGKTVVHQRGIVTNQKVGDVNVFRARTLAVLHKSFIWRIASFLSFMVSSFWAGLRAGPVDLVMGTTPPIFQAVSAWCISMLRRKPFMLEIRDLWPEFAIDMGVLKNPMLIWLSRGLERFLYGRAHHLVVNSPAYKTYLMERFHIPERKISLIPNGVDISKFNPSDVGSELKKEWGLENKFIVMYAGAIGLANDVPVILNAAKRLEKEKDIVFVFAGDGKERDKMQMRTESMNLKNVKFVGSYPKTRMPQVLAASNLCLATLQNIPMFRTTYPNKVFDYMAAGKPTLLAIDGVIREVIEASGGGIFVSPGNDQSLAESILQLRNHPDKVKDMGLAARAYVSKNFNRRDQADAFRKLVEGICDKEKLKS